MKTNSNLHVSQLAGNAIVPVEANGVYATAFFVAPNKLLTARHFVIDAEVEEGERDVIHIKVNGGSHACTYTEIANKGYDVVILTTQDFRQQKEFCLTLLSAPMIDNQQLMIIGYPKELGNNVDYFTIEVQNFKDMKAYPMGYDTIVRRISDNVFQSYKGFSGAPVLNRCNQVIGVVTDQFTGSLGYMSVFRMSEPLELKGIVMSRDAESADDRAFGLYTCRNLMARSITKASSRYNEDLHQENHDFTNMMDNVTKRNVPNPYYRIWDQLVNWFKLVGSTFACYPEFDKALKDLEAKKYTPIEFEELRRLVCAKDVGLLKQEDTPDEKLMNRLRDIGYELSDVEYSEREYSAQFICISGAAGTGKTHLLCHYAKMFTDYSHAYLLFGSDFQSESKDAFDEILTHINMSETEFADLNELLTKHNRYGLIVIDALNEGAGQNYWKLQLPNLMTKLKDYTRIKLMVSARIDSDKFILGDNGDDWLTLEVYGFEDMDAAVSAYFKEFDIPIHVEDVFRNFSSFRNPLFLYIFCIAYKRMPYQYRRNLTHLTIYWYYLLERNNRVSEIVDEDPLRTITSSYLMALAKDSLANYNCDVIDRKKAREIADYMAVVPGWSHNLLYACEKENLLRMTFRRNDELCTAFEFENLGDFLKAKAWKDLFAKKPYTELLDDINRRFNEPNATKDLEHVVEALLSICDKENPMWDDESILNGQFTPYVLNSLQYHKAPNEFEEYTAKVVGGILDKDKYRISPEFLRKQVLDIGYSAMMKLHEILKSKSQNELDEFWTDRVNRLYTSWKGHLDLNFTATVHDKQRAMPHVMLMCWFSASSYPIIRAHAQRALFEDFMNSPETILEAMRIFRDVKDPYVIQSLYVAVYGFMLKQIIKRPYSEPLSGFNIYQEIKSIGEYIYQEYYSRAELVPQDIIARYWQMKVIERVAYLFPEFQRWEELKGWKRFVPQKSPMYTGREALESKKDYLDVPDDRNYGLTNSLFSQMSDFCRYTLHMNNTMSSYTYFAEKDNKKSGVSMLDVQRSIIQLIKTEIGWNEALAKLDKDHGSTGRFHNDKERIGKKYQWMALYKIEAYLSDKYFMRKEYWGDDAVLENNYPWYSPNRPYFDPCLSMSNLDVSKSLTDKMALSKRDFIITADEVERWHTSVQKYSQVFEDSDGVEWVPIFLFDTKDTGSDTPKGVPQLHQFMMYNSFFCKDADGDTLYEWACKQDFCSRWMSEPGDSIHFLWNEYPWSESFKGRYMEDEQSQQNRDCPITLTVASIGQLQENSEGLPPDTEYISTVYAPNPHVMETLGLYTAERGVVKRVDGDEVISFNIRKEGTSFSGMFMKKSVLMEYLQKTGQRLFICLCGEKFGQIAATAIGLKSFTGSYQINSTGDVVNDDRFHYVEPHLPEPPSEDADPYEFLLEIDEDQDLTKGDMSVDKPKKSKVGKKKRKKKRRR